MSYEYLIEWLQAQSKDYVEHVRRIADFIKKSEGGATREACIAMKREALLAPK